MKDELMGGTWGTDLESAATEDDRRLLKAIFNPQLSDRCNDGSLFVAPDTSAAYVEQLRKLVKEEEQVQQQRKEHFFSTDFKMDDVGALFPSSWTSQIEIAGERDVNAQGSLLQPRVEYAAQTDMLDGALKTASPMFDKSTEDGL